MKSEAKKYFSQSLSYSPYRSGYTYCIKALWFLDNNNYTGALREINFARNIEPDFADVYWIEGLIFEQIGDWRRAHYFYSRALTISPFHRFAIEGLERINLTWNRILKLKR